MEAGNLTSNSSGIMRHGRRSTKSLDFAIPYTATSGIFSFVGGVSNLFVLFVLLKYVRLKQNTHVYMLSLFLSDILYNCVVQPHVCYYQFPSTVVTFFGRKYIHAASLVCILIGTLSLFFASLDKYIFIAHPFFYGNYITKRKTRVVVICMWLACLTLGVMRFYEIVLVKDGYLAVIAAAFVLTILVQMMIFVVAREQGKRIQQLHRSLEHNHPHDGGEGSAVQSHSSQSSNKAAKTIGFLLVVYIASWLPANIYRQEYRWNGGDPVLYHKWVKIINLMIQLHSCINPYVFVLRSKDMKSAIAKFLRALGVRQCLGGERESQVIVGSNGNNLTASSQARSSKVNIYESGDDVRNENNQGHEISDQRNGDTAGSCEEIELGHLNTSYENSCGNNASENTTDGPNNDNGQSGNIQQGVHSSDITLENVGRKRDERIKVNENSLKTAFNVNDSKEERMVSVVSGNNENEENMESTDIRENGNGLRMLESQSVDINTRDNDSRGEGRANSENEKNTQY